jgi:hypothetical protein
MKHAVIPSCRITVSLYSTFGDAKAVQSTLLGASMRWSKCDSNSQPVGNFAVIVALKDSRAAIFANVVFLFKNEHH